MAFACLITPGCSHGDECIHHLDVHGKVDFGDTIFRCTKCHRQFDPQFLVSRGCSWSHTRSHRSYRGMVKHTTESSDRSVDELDGGFKRFDLVRRDGEQTVKTILEFYEPLHGDGHRTKAALKGHAFDAPDLVSQPLGRAPQTALQPAKFSKPEATAHLCAPGCGLGGNGVHYCDLKVGEEHELGNMIFKCKSCFRQFEATHLVTTGCTWRLERTHRGTSRMMSNFETNKDAKDDNGKKVFDLRRRDGHQTVKAFLQLDALDSLDAFKEGGSTTASSVSEDEELCARHPKKDAQKRSTSVSGRVDARQKEDHGLRRSRTSKPEAVPWSISGVLGFK